MKLFSEKPKQFGFLTLFFPKSRRFDDRGEKKV